MLCRLHCLDKVLGFEEEGEVMVSSSGKRTAGEGRTAGCRRMKMRSCLYNILGFRFTSKLRSFRIKLRSFRIKLRSFVVYDYI